MLRTPNTDGLINCLPQPGQTSYGDLKATLRSLSANYGYERSFSFDHFINTTCFSSFTKIRRLRSCHLPGLSWAAGRRTGALFFALHRDYFIVTRNFSFTYRDLVPFNSFTVTLGYSSIYLDWRKTRHRDMDDT